MSADLPNLDEFIGGYFHQDWRDDASTAMAVVERYISEWPADEVVLAANELQLLLDTTAAEELGQSLKELGSYYDPTADGLSHEGWLQQVLKKLRGG